MENQNKEAVRLQFSQNVLDYRDSVLFAEGEDLRKMVDSVPLVGHERVLDLGTGAGHTALAFSHFVSECVGMDLTEAMVEVATRLADERGISNVKFQVGDAENIPFPSDTFDVVTCRFASHHFGDIKKAIQEISRVLKPDGTLILVDHYSPENDGLDLFVNHLDRLRDPSHVREYRLSEYRLLFEDSAMEYKELSTWDLTLDFQDWVERARTPESMRNQLVAHLQGASEMCRDEFHVQLNDDGTTSSFCLKCALLQGIRQ